MNDIKMPPRTKVLRFKEDKPNCKVTGIIPIVVSDYLLKANTIVYSGSDGKGYFYIYEDGKYNKIGDEGIVDIIINFLRKYNEPQILTNANCTEVKCLMYYQMKHIKSTEFNTNYDIVNFQNGILDLKTMKLLSHSPEYYSTIQIPAKWIPNDVETPTFDKFMDHFTALHSDSDEVKTMLMEFLGLSISNIPGYRFKKSLLLVGKGNTGKSVFRNLAIGLIGNDNTASIEFSSLESQFGTSAAFGKRIIGSDDMQYGTTSQISKFKQITGGGSVSIESKFKNPFDTRLNGVFWNCANDVPLFGGDKGEWVYDRFLLVNCDNVVSKSERDPMILDKMLNEKEGIVRKAILALKEAIENNYEFVVPQSTVEALKKYRKENDICIEFFDTFCFLRNSDECEKKLEAGYTVSIEPHSEADLRKTFEGWAKSNYGRVPKKNEFENAVAEHLSIGINELHCRTSNRRSYIFDITEECRNDWIYS